MLATIEEITDALKAAVEAIPAVRGFIEWAGPMAISGNASGAVIEYDGCPGDVVMDDDSATYNFKITMLVPKLGTDDRTGRNKLYAFCDPGSSTSVRRAVNGSLGDVVAFATVGANTGLQEYRPGGDEGPAYLGVEFSVAVGT